MQLYALLGLKQETTMLVAQGYVLMVQKKSHTKARTNALSFE